MLQKLANGCFSCFSALEIEQSWRFGKREQAVGAGLSFVLCPELLHLPLHGWELKAGWENKKETGCTLGTPQPGARAPPRAPSRAPGLCFSLTPQLMQGASSPEHAQGPVHTQQAPGVPDVTAVPHCFLNQSSQVHGKPLSGKTLNRNCYQEPFPPLHLWILKLHINLTNILSI